MESNSISLKDVWAKTDPFQSIMTHATLSGLAAQVIWEKLPEGVREELVRLLSSTQEQGKAWLGYLVSLHDIGKVEELFQWQWPEMRARMEKAGKKPEFADTKVRHERTTAAALNERIWKELGAEKSLRSFYAGVLGAHHQGKDGKGGSKHTKNSSFWNGLQAEPEETMRHLFLKTDVVFFPPVEKPQKGPAGALNRSLSSKQTKKQKILLKMVSVICRGHLFMQHPASYGNSLVRGNLDDADAVGSCSNE